jgi:soluble lytic murein transglycosylase-like protein
MRFASALVASLLSMGVNTFADQTVFLTGGFTMKADSSVRDGDTFVLTVGTGTIQIPAVEVLRVEDTPSPSAPLLAVKPKPSTADILDSAASAQGLPARFVASVAKAESGGRIDAISPKGAIGLMQLMPATANELGVAVKDPSANALGGSKYLRSLLIRYHGDAALALAAYNAGPGAVAKFGGVPPFPETRAYIARVLRFYAAQDSASHRVSETIPNKETASR